MISLTKEQYQNVVLRLVSMSERNMIHTQDEKYLDAQGKPLPNWNTPGVQIFSIQGAIHLVCHELLGTTPNKCTYRGVPLKLYIVQRWFHKIHLQLPRITKSLLMED